MRSELPRLHELRGGEHDELNVMQLHVYELLLPRVSVKSANASRECFLPFSRH